MRSPLALLVIAAVVSGCASFAARYDVRPGADRAAQFDVDRESCEREAKSSSRKKLGDTTAYRILTPLFGLAAVVALLPSVGRQPYYDPPPGEPKGEGFFESLTLTDDAAAAAAYERCLTEHGHTVQPRTK